MPDAVDRFTTEYIPDEDRMRVSVAFKDGSVQVLWLTQRLLDRLLAQLVAQIGSAPLPGGAPKSPVAAKAQQRFNQQAAAASITPQKPVRVKTHEQQVRPPTLITSIDLGFGKTVVRVDFRAGEAVMAQLPFSKEALRQWFSVLYKRYEEAGWSGAFWPDWIRSDADMTEAGSTRVN